MQVDFFNDNPKPIEKNYSRNFAAKSLLAHLVGLLLSIAQHVNKKGFL